MKKTQVRTLSLILFLIGVAVVALAFLPALKYGDNETTYTGFQIITGLTVFNIAPVADGKLPFSILALFAFLLPILAWALGGAMGKGFVLSLLLFAAAAVLLFLLPQYTRVIVTSFIGGPTEWDPNWVLQIGPIIAGGLSVLGAVVSLLGFRQTSH